MKTAFDNKELAHQWFHRLTPEGNASHYYFRGDTIYSYGSHFPIARHYKGVVLFNSGGYSSTTARHMSLTRAAIPDSTPVFYVPRPDKNPCAKHV